MTALARLNDAARSHSYGLEDLDWSLAVDRGRPWAPEGLTPICYAPSYARLEPAARLRVNQLTALALVEKFVWFERHVVGATSAVLRHVKVDTELAQALRHVVAEETKHLAMFARLLSRSEPGWYGASRKHLFRPSLPQRLAVASIASRPHWFLSWTWLSIFVEERALFLARNYQRTERERPGALDRLHAEVHAFHLRDEARHCSLDRHLLAALYDPQPRWKKAIGARMLAAGVRSYVQSTSLAHAILAQLGREFPALREASIARIAAELPRAASKADYRSTLFGRGAMPRTLALLRGYPEHERSLAWLATEPA